MRLVFDSLTQLLPPTSSSDCMLLDDHLSDSERSYAAQHSEFSWEGIPDSDDRVNDGVNDVVKDKINNEVKCQAEEAEDEEQAWKDFVFGYERQQRDEVSHCAPSFPMKADEEAAKLFIGGRWHSVAEAKKSEAETI